MLGLESRTSMTSKKIEKYIGITLFIWPLLISLLPLTSARANDPLGIPVEFENDEDQPYQGETDEQGLPTDPDCYDNRFKCHNGKIGGGNKLKSITKHAHSHSHNSDGYDDDAGYEGRGNSLREVVIVSTKGVDGSKRRGPVRTLEYALQKISPSGRILIEPGVYNEPGLYISKPVSIQAASPNGKVIIRSYPSSSAIRMKSSHTISAKSHIKKASAAAGAPKKVPYLGTNDSIDWNKKDPQPCIVYDPKTRLVGDKLTISGIVFEPVDFEPYVNMPPLPQKSRFYRNGNIRIDNDTPKSNSCIQVVSGELVMNDSDIHYYSERLTSGLDIKAGRAILKDVSLVGSVATPCMGPGRLPHIVDCPICEKGDTTPLPIPVTSCQNALMNGSYASAVSSIPSHETYSPQKMASRDTKRQVDQRYKEGFRRPVGMAFAQIGYLERGSTGIRVGQDAQIDVQGERIWGFDVGVDFLGSGALDNVKINGNGFGVHVAAQTPWDEQKTISVNDSEINGNKVGMVVRSGFAGNLSARKSDVKYNEIQGIYMGDVDTTLQCHMATDVEVKRNGSRIAATDWITRVFSLWAAHEIAVWAHDSLGGDRLILLGSALLALDQLPSRSPSAVAELRPIFGQEVDSYNAYFRSADYRPKKPRRGTKWRVNNPNFVLTQSARDNCLLPARSTKFFGGRRLGIFATEKPSF